MMPDLSSGNLLSWAAQVFVMGSLGALLPYLFRIRHPRTLLVYCQSVLVLCLVLPFAQPWRHSDVVAVSDHDGPVTAVAAPTTGPVRPVVPGIPVVVWIFAAGIAVKGCWFLGSLWQIRQYRRASRPLRAVPKAVASSKAMTKTDALFCVSGRAQGPGTFGVFRSVVLLPESFLTLQEPVQEVIACHELLHVRRRDWLITILEESVGVLFWFHPA